MLANIPSRTDYVDEVYRALLDAISDGTLAPGARVTQEDLADRLNVSRSPVLQALRMLKKDGLLEDAPGRGLLVTRLEPLSISQLCRVRGALDALAARVAAECRAEIPAALISAGRQRCARHDRGGFRVSPRHLRSLGQPLGTLVRSQTAARC